MDAQPAAIFELPLLAESNREAPDENPAAECPPALFVGNALWFCKLRWWAIGGLYLIAIIAFLAEAALGERIQTLGLRLHSTAAFVLASLLLAINTGYLRYLRGLSNDPTNDSQSRRASVHLKIQIIIDLLLLTAAVHFLGSIETYAPFFYLFHIVLASLFFPYRQGFLILLAASVFYIGLLGLEAAGVLSPRFGLFTDPTFRASFSELQILVNLGILLSIWLIIGYLGSHLARMIYERDHELAEANRELLRSQKEKTRHMLRTTHELKAPFAAIHANTQLLINGYCGSLAPEALAVVRRIGERGRRLSHEIQSMLQLANLTSIEPANLKWGKVHLDYLLEKALDQVRSLTEEREIQLDVRLEPASTVSVEDHLLMLFSNLLQNAILYSHRGGLVKLSCRKLASNDAEIIIEDQGIGIPPEKLPRIFEEYYRTEEAAAHNKDSSGLGLAIVRTVAQTHGICIRVESTQNRGSRFICRVPLRETAKLAHEETKVSPAWLRRAAAFFNAG